MKAIFLKYWFMFTSFCMPLIYILLQKRNSQIKELDNELKEQKLANSLNSVSEKAKLSEESYEKIHSSYSVDKSIHSELLTKIGISTGEAPKPDSK